MEVGAEVEAGAPKVLRHLQEDPLIKRQEVEVEVVAVAAAVAEWEKLGRQPPNHSWQRGPLEVEVERVPLLLRC